MPPRTLLRIVPETVSPSLYFARIASQRIFSSAWRLETTTMPFSPSSSMSSTSKTSPTFTSSTFSNSLAGMAPALLHPMSTNTSFPRLPVTLPLTMVPGAGTLSCLFSAAKSSS